MQIRESSSGCPLKIGSYELRVAHVPRQEHDLVLDRDARGFPRWVRSQLPKGPLDHAVRAELRIPQQPSRYHHSGHYGQARHSRAASFFRWVAELRSSKSGHWRREESRENWQNLEDAERSDRQNERQHQQNVRKLERSGGDGWQEWSNQICSRVVLAQRDPPWENCETQTLSCLHDHGCHDPQFPPPTVPYLQRVSPPNHSCGHWLLQLCRQVSYWLSARVWCEWLMWLDGAS